MFEDDTLAFEPIAVEFDTIKFGFSTSAINPTAVLFDPTPFEYNAKLPIATLLFPDSLYRKV